MIEDKGFSKVTLTSRQKRQLQSVLKEIHENDPYTHPEITKGMLSWVKSIKLRIEDLFDRKQKVDNTYEFFKPYYDLVGLDAYSDDSGHPFRTKAATCRSEATLGSHCVP